VATACAADVLAPHVAGLELRPEFENLVRLTADSDIGSSPLCDACAGLATEQVVRWSDHFQRFVDDVVSINRYGSGFAKRIIAISEVRTPFPPVARAPTGRVDSAPADPSPVRSPVALPRSAPWGR